MLSRQPVIFVEYVNAAWSGDADVPFYEKLKAYQNRPFDDMKAVKPKMKPEDEAAFTAYWDAQVQTLKAFEDTLSIRYPLDRDTLLSVLPQLEGKLNELVSRLTDELTNQLKEEGTYDAATKACVETMARACAFHLLTKSKTVSAENDAASVKRHQEFNRLLRKSLFRGDILNYFSNELTNVFNDKSSFNETKVGLYTGIFGDMAEQAYFHGVEDNINSLSAMELDGILKTLGLLKNKKVVSGINELVNRLWEDKWDQYARENISNTNVSLASNLFMLLNSTSYRLGEPVKRNILLLLCKLAYEGKFDGTNTGDRVYQFRDAFIQKIVDLLTNVSPVVRDEIASDLKSRFHDFKDKKIQTAIGERKQKSVKGLFSSAAAAAAEAVNTVTSSSSSSKKKDGPK